MRSIPSAILLALASMFVGGCADSEARDPEPEPALALDLSLGNVLDPNDAADVAVSLVLSNVGGTKALVNARLLVNAPDRAHEVVLQVIGPDKQPRRFTALVDAREASRTWKTVAPGRRVIGVARIGKLFDLSQKGFYAVQAVYENRQDAPGGGTAWKGLVASNVLRFERK